MFLETAQQSTKPKSIYPLDPISCAIYSFSLEEIKAHTDNIQEGLKLNATKIKEMCKPIMQELFAIPHAASVFGIPVDPKALGLPDYFDIIKFPMDLGLLSIIIMLIQFITSFIIRRDCYEAIRSRIVSRFALFCLRCPSYFQQCHDIQSKNSALQKPEARV